MLKGKKRKGQGWEGTHLAGSIRQWSTVPCALRLEYSSYSEPFTPCLCGPVNPFSEQCLWFESFSLENIEKHQRDLLLSGVRVSKYPIVFVIISSTGCGVLVRAYHQQVAMLVSTNSRGCETGVCVSCGVNGMSCKEYYNGIRAMWAYMVCVVYVACMMGVSVYYVCTFCVVCACTMYTA